MNDVGHDRSFKNDDGFLEACFGTDAEMAASCSKDAKEAEAFDSDGESDGGSNSGQLQTPTRLSPSNPAAQASRRLRPGAAAKTRFAQVVNNSCAICKDDSQDPQSSDLFGYQMSRDSSWRLHVSEEQCDAVPLRCGATMGFLEI